MQILFMNFETKEVSQPETLVEAVSALPIRDLGETESLRYDGIRYVAYYVRGTEHFREIHVWRLW